RLFDGALFRSSRCDTKPRVVDEKVDATARPNDIPHGGVDGFVAVDVEGQHLKRSLLPVGFPPTGPVDRVPGHGEPLRRCFTNARRRTCYEGDWSCDPGHRVS